jgi:hypothetical protein
VEISIKINPINSVVAKSHVGFLVFHFLSMNNISTEEQILNRFPFEGATEITKRPVRGNNMVLQRDWKHFYYKSLRHLSREMVHHNTRIL